MWKGFITQTWGDIQEAFLCQQGTSIKSSGTTWAKNVIKTIWQYFLGVWLLRNVALHKRTNETPAHCQSLQMKAVKLYEEHWMEKGKYKFLFRHTKTQVRNYKDNQLQRWIELAEMIAVQNRVKTVKTAHFGSDIKKYLIPSSHKLP